MDMGRLDKSVVSRLIQVSDTHSVDAQSNGILKSKLGSSTRNMYGLTGNNQDSRG